MAGIYLHIPFCKSRCIYCDFYSSTQSDLKDQYVHALCSELISRIDYLQGEPINTIYFGGGTPSQLEKKDFEQIFNTISSAYGMEFCREITLEANPDDLSAGYLAEISSLPFNRLSIGIQTFSDDTLRLLKRRHTSSQAIRAIENARNAGFRNISIDLIYGLPGETTETWEQDLLQAIRLDVEHISAYHLTYEEGTPIHNMLQQHAIEEVEEDKSLTFFASLRNKLEEAGYEHYEISNFSKPGKQSMHNSSYWNGTKYLGCGASAHSYNGDSREWNVSSIGTYIKGIEQNNRVYEKEILNKNTRYNDLIITSLRTKQGLSLSQLEQEYGSLFLQKCLRAAQKHIANKDLEVRDNKLRLTPKGIFISDSIMSDLLCVDMV